MRNLNAMTPETETTTHYFWGQAHDFQPHNPEMTERVFQQIKTAFLEDVSVFTMQQANQVGRLDPAGAATLCRECGFRQIARRIESLAVPCQ